MQDTKIDGYAPWQIKKSDFPKNQSIEEKIKFLLNYAILAPSAHNTQPWAFSVSQNIATFYINPKRVLKDSDVFGRQAYISMGCALENFFSALKCFGMAGRYEFEKNLPQRPYMPKEPFVVFKVYVEDAKEGFLNETAATADAKNLCDYIPTRRSTRVPFFNKPLPQEYKTFLDSMQSENGIKTILIEDQERKAIAAEAVRLGTIASFNMPEFRRELSVWVKPNWSKDPLGMPGRNVGMPGVMSYLGPKVMRYLNIGKMHSRLMQKTVQDAPGICIVYSNDDSEDMWVLAGRVAERMVLNATPFLLGASFMGAATEFDEVAFKLSDDLKLNGRPLVFFIVGEPKKSVPFSPRLPLNMCFVQNARN